LDFWAALGFLGFSFSLSHLSTLSHHLIHGCLRNPLSSQKLLATTTIIDPKKKKKIKEQQQHNLRHTNNKSNRQNHHLQITTKHSTYIKNNTKPRNKSKSSTIQQEQHQTKT
jgi:acetyl/propionyl-CoA carboxylase alpha subunit